MDKNINDYISKQPPARQKILTSINLAILVTDKTVKAAVESMMGKEMIVYKGKGQMKYALASVKNYMSLHLMPIYGSGTLHSKYKTLLNKANFQKGCINFDNEDQMPMDIVQKLIEDCSSVDLLKLRRTHS